MTGYILPYACDDGPANMALDEAMLEASARDVAAYLRFYGWTVPTLSLGYFQRLDQVRAESRWQGVPTVRRPTGGGAIWHHRELTYAIAVPPGSPLSRPNTALYRAVHAAIAECLDDAGIPARRRGGEAPTQRNGPERPILCFTGGDPEDIVSGGHKLVGSAQRRRDGAILQHGSLLLARSPGVPELLGVCDVADVPGSSEYWRGRLEDRLPAAMAVQPMDVGWPDRLRERALELERSRYRSREWTEAR